MVCLSWVRRGGAACWRRQWRGAGGGGAARWRLCARGGAEGTRAAQGGGAGVRGRRTAAARACSGGARRRCDGKATAQWNGERRRRVVGETREEERPAARGQEIYDKWAPQNFLTPVDPTLRVWTPVDCVGVVYPRLHQICISTPVEPMLPKMNLPVDCTKRRLIARSDLY